MKKGNLFVVSGPSGAGKGTICAAFAQRRPEVFLSVSATTREPREGEVEGVHYYFLGEEEFKEKITQGDFLEHAVYCGNYYGTPRGKVMEVIESGRDVILEIESDGAMQVRSRYPEGIFIFVCPPSLQTLEARLRGRGTESEEVIAQRLEKAVQELGRAHKYNYLLLNDDVEAAVRRLEAIVDAERCYMPRNIGFINDFIKNKEK